MHVGLEYALCSQCMCLIEAFTRCVAFPVPQSTLVLSSQVRKESACSCSCCGSAKIGLACFVVLDAKACFALCSAPFSLLSLQGTN